MNTDRTLKLTAFFRSAAITALFGALVTSAAAQPSGGPYGPVRQVWQVPEKAGKIIYVAPDGDAAAAGDKITAPSTIEAAIAKATTGDVIIMRGGTYRTGDLLLNQGITIQP